jgi:hypothetical protein
LEAGDVFMGRTIPEPAVRCPAFFADFVGIFSGKRQTTDSAGSAPLSRALAGGGPARFNGYGFRVF